MLQKNITKKFLQTLEKIEYGRLKVVLPSGATYQFGNSSDDLSAILNIINTKVLLNLWMKGDIGLASSYRDGDFTTDNLANLLIIGLKNEHIMNKYIYSKFIYTAVFKFIYLLKMNTLVGSKKNVKIHYDLGNDFYSLWLDKTMTYSSALFDNNDISLEQGQQQKYDRIIGLFNKSSGNVLEIGCGWGGFIDRLINTSNTDYSIKGITLSQKQFSYAKNRTNNAASIMLEDYRTQNEKYDFVVSIEMFEAVGQKYWSTYFTKIKQFLKINGKAIIQTIMINDNYYKKYVNNTDMIRTFIFPGGMLPSYQTFIQEATKNGLKVKSFFPFGKDYEKTLTIWSNNFENNISKIKDLSFDDKFINIWRFYFAACIAGFNVGRTSVSQIELTHQ